MRPRNIRLSKEASALSPEALFFFRDEMRKEAIFTPRSAIKAMSYAKPGMLGNMVRRSGNLGWKAQMAVTQNAPALIHSAATTGSLLPAVAGIATGGAAKAVGRKAPMLSSLAENIVGNV